MTEEYDRALAPVGLRLNQYAVLANLARLGSAPVTELAQALELDQTSTTRSVALLEQLGLVQRKAHQDPRVKLLALTEEGKLRLKSARTLWKQVQAKMQNRISDSEWALVVSAMQKLRV